MFAFLEGEIAAKSRSTCVLDVHGVGYELLMPQSSLEVLPAAGDRVRLLTHLSISDSGAQLYGFLSPDDKDLFMSLIAVSGIGPKIALAALSTLTPAELIDAVAAEDVKTLSKIPSIGKKTAQRIVLELKGSLPDSSPADEVAVESTSVGKVVTEALLSMGFTSSEIALAMKDAPVEATEETLLQYALKRIG
ncbi:MAG: Holliday junction branch migration protein RuvA [Eggerthellaceae bacterium]|nr:Holliday junction branch migration protein RuvA [Eggerthellaceae bacterium]